MGITLDGDGSITSSSGSISFGDENLTTTGTIPSSQLTGALPALSAANLTAIPAANISGVIPPANLGTGTANSSTFLNGSGAYSAAGGGAWELVDVSVGTNVASVQIGSVASPIAGTSDFGKTFCIIGTDQRCEFDQRCLIMQMGHSDGSGGITFLTTGYKSHNIRSQSNNHNYAASASNSGSPQIQNGINIINTVTIGSGHPNQKAVAQFTCWVDNIGGSSGAPASDVHVYGTGGGSASGSLHLAHFGGVNEQTTSNPIIAVRFLYSTGGNIKTGTFRTYKLQSAI